MSTIDTIKHLIDKAGRTFTGASWDTGPDMVVSALERGDTKRASEPDSGLDVPNDGSMEWGGLRQRWIDLLRDCEHSDGSNVSDLLAEAEAIRDENHDYVVECADECEGYGAEAIKALDLGMIDEAIAMLESAVTVERAFGDAPAWHPALDAARAYAATLAEEDVDEDEDADEDADDLVSLTPNEAWNTYVGSQPVSEFVANGGDVVVYAACAPSCEGLTDDEREAVAALLARHIAAQG